MFESTLFRISSACSSARVALLLLALWQSAALAQPGTVLFTDNFNNLNNWTRSSTSDAGVNTVTSSSANSSLFIRDGATVTSDAIDAAVPAARLQVWIRRGSSSVTGSGTPDSGENLIVEYENESGVWVPLETFLGAGTAWQVYTPSYDLPVEALHSNLSIRFRMLAADNSDYWHIDDPVITELAAPVPFAVGACDNFESGLDGWNLNTLTGGLAGVSTATANSPTSSLYTRSGPVTVTSNPISLSGQLLVNLNLWIRRGGSFAGANSDRPEAGDTLVVEYRTSADTWSVLQTFAGIDSGNGGQIFTGSYDLPADAFHSGFRIQLRQTNGTAAADYWHIDDVCLTLEQAISYSFDEDQWTGAAAGEVVEDSPNGLNGTAMGQATTDDATPARANDPGTCGYAALDGDGDYVQVADNPALDISSELTLSAWIRMRSAPPELHTIVSKDTNYEYHIDATRHLYWWWNDSGGTVRSITTTTQIALNTWYHVAVTYQSGTQRMYINGAVQGTTGSYTGTLAQNNESLYIGTDVNFLSPRAFDGNIDEVRIIPRALTAAEIQTLYTETHPCPTVAAQFTISHNGYAIHCLAETITVNVIDANAGTQLNNYNAQVQLETRLPAGGALTGFGTWSLVSGGGTFSDGAANDGIATYTWPLGEDEAVFGLYYPQGNPIVDVEVFQVSDSGIRDTDAEGNLVFSPNGFTLTAAPLANPPGVVTPFATNQTAGTAFPLYITAYGQLPGDPTCGVIETYTGAKDLKFWFNYVDPIGGTLSFTINGTPIQTVEGSAAVESVTFTGGQTLSSVAVKYKDVGSAQLFVKDDTTGNLDLPNGIRGQTASFVHRPARFVLSGILNGAVVNPQAANATGGVFNRAGRPFQATVEARDSENAVTPNYGREIAPEGVRLEVQLVAPAGGASPAVSGTFGGFSDGSASGTTFTWPEVGIIQLNPRVNDLDYLGAGDVAGSVSERIGRFVPDHFVVTLNTPLLQPACSTAAAGFTYVGQAFNYFAGSQPQITATAKAADGTTTTANYRFSVVAIDNYFKLATGTSLNRMYSSSAGSLNANNVPPITSDPAVAVVANGVGRLTFSSGTGLFYDRSAPAARFQPIIQLSIDVRDADGVTAAGNPVVFGSPSGISFNVPADFRYGRIRILNAIGSERVDLPVRMIAEQYESAGVGFVGNALDTCTTNVSLAFAGFTENLGVGETCVRDSGSPGLSGVGCAAAAAAGTEYREPPSAGDFNLRLAAPGAGKNGSLLINATVPTWLRYDWNTATGGDENPSGQATFGIFGGEARQIYLREIY